MSDETLFHEARQKPADERTAFLDEACGGDTALRERVKALLAAYDDPDGFLEKPAVEFGATVDLSPAAHLLAERPGTLIGPYKLLEQIGEGGMGVVYMADQQTPVRRRVALKIIKAGMDTRQVIARFEAERQALAMMDHSNIARVFEAGATDTGRPYFVMELVRGIPITHYCDESKLTTIDRLKLFIAVCSAVQHAHQKGIIHRDLKPTNILVTLYDDRPVPKIIDFGIAKATQARLTERTLFTEYRQMIGTPAYMSPEQAQMSGIDVDTRSDIYSLGVLLYELLAGTTPFAVKELLSAGYAEMQRMIREVEPPPPSTRLSNSKDLLRSISAQRQTEPAKLTKLLRGDLDWIVMRCLEKDRTRRYDTATGLAQDIERYLSDEPVEARRPTQFYRLKKFVRRNRVGVLAGTAIAAAMAVGLILASVGFIQARRQADIAHAQASRSEQVAQFLKDMLQGVGPSVALGRDTTMLHEIVDKTAKRIDTDLKDQPDVEIELRATLAQVYEQLQDYQTMEQTARETLRLARAHFGEENTAVADALSQLGTALVGIRKVDEAETCARQAVAMQRKVHGNDSLQEASALGLLADVLRHQSMLSSGSSAKSKLAEAEAAIRAAMKINEKRLGDKNFDVAWAPHCLATVLRDEGKAAEAEQTYREELAIDLRLYGEEHPATANTYEALASIIAAGSADRLEEAESMLRKVLQIQQRTEGEGTLSQYYSHWSLADVLNRQHRFADAETHHRAALTIARNRMGSDNPDLAAPIAGLASILRKQGKLAEARPLAEEAVDICQRLPDRVDRWMQELSIATLRDVLTDLGDTAAIKALDAQLAAKMK